MSKAGTTKNDTPPKKGAVIPLKSNRVQQKARDEAYRKIKASNQKSADIQRTADNLRKRLSDKSKNRTQLMMD